MNSGVNVTTNLPEFKAQLRAIGTDMERRAVRQASAAAASVFRSAVQRNAPVQAPPGRKGHVVGTLRRAIYARKLKAERGTVIYRIGVRQGRGEQKRNRDAYYWAWVEQGHIARGPGGALKGGVRSKSLQRLRLRAGGGKVVPPHPFFKPAFESAGSRALQVFNERLTRAIAKYSQKTK